MSRAHSVAICNPCIIWHAATRAAKAWNRTKTGRFTGIAAVLKAATAVPCAILAGAIKGIWRGAELAGSRKMV